jgi:hypothetical protein
MRQNLNGHPGSIKVKTGRYHGINISKTRRRIYVVQSLRLWKYEIIARTLTNFLQGDEITFHLVLGINIQQLLLVCMEFCCVLQYWQVF